MNHRFFLKLWLEMRLGAMVMTRKQDKHWATGKCLILQNQRRPDRFDQMLRSCWLVFLMLMEMRTRNLFLLDKLWINKFYLKVLKRLCNGVRKKRPEMWSSGDGFFQNGNAPTHMALSVQQFFAKKQNDCYPSSSLFTQSCTMQLLPVPSYERPDEREMFCWCQRSEKENAGGLEQHQHWRVPEMFSA